MRAAHVSDGFAVTHLSARNVLSYQLRAKTSINLDLVSARLQTVGI